MTSRPNDDHVHPDIERQLSDLKITVSALQAELAALTRAEAEQRQWIRDNVATKDQVEPLIKMAWLVTSAVVLTLVGAIMALVLVPKLS